MDDDFFGDRYRAPGPSPFVMAGCLGLVIGFAVAAYQILV